MHNMQTYHSTVDIGDNHENAPKYKMFLSLIVNYACEVETKITIQAESEETTVTWFNWRVKGFKLSNKERKRKDSKDAACYVIDCNTVFQQDEWFVKTVKELATKKITPISNYKPNTAKKITRTITGYRKVGYLDYNQAIYSEVFDVIGELIMLGTVKKTTPRLALDKASDYVDTFQTDDYKKAIKQYYETWYTDHFMWGKRMDWDEEEILLVCIRIMDILGTFYISQFAEKAFNELLDEIEYAEYAEQSV